VEKAWIDGHEYFDREQDMDDRSKKALEKRALTEKAAPVSAGRTGQAPAAGGPKL
jgi:hypothetical protein